MPRSVKHLSRSGTRLFPEVQTSPPYKVIQERLVVAGHWEALARKYGVRRNERQFSDCRHVSKYLAPAESRRGCTGNHQFQGPRQRKSKQARNSPKGVNQPNSKLNIRTFTGVQELLKMMIRLRSMPYKHFSNPTHNLLVAILTIDFTSLKIGHIQRISTTARPMGGSSSLRVPSSTWSASPAPISAILRSVSTCVDVG